MTRMRGLLLVAMLLVVALVVTPPASGQTQNLLLNPGFEDGLSGHAWMPAAWDTSHSGIETAFFARDSFSARSGRYGVSVASASTYIPIAYNWSLSLFVTPDMWGKDAVFTIWTRSNGLEGRGYVLLQAFRDTVSKMARVWNTDRHDAQLRLRLQGVEDDATDLGWKRVWYTESETDWVERSARIYVPPTTNMIYVRSGLYGTGQLLLDDASLTLEEPLPVAEPPLKANLLSDPGFETMPSTWEISMPPYPRMRAVLDTVVHRSGRSSLRFSGSGGFIPGRAGAAQVLCNHNLSGKRLRLSAWLRADSLQTSAFLRVFCHTDSSLKQQASIRLVSGTTDWVPVIVESDVPPRTYAVWAWIEYTAPCRGRLWMDDASLEALGPATGAPTPTQSQFGFERPLAAPAAPAVPDTGKSKRRSGARR